uniref:RWP-RK domain-containing protein n=1 Tax=Oryza glumipatula TaxID=40148 RepID=A0A0D9Y608_9ORYZ
MASTAQPQQQPQQQQEQQPVAAAAAVPTPAPPASEAQPQKPTRVSLSYEEISKLFSLPIAEAASILGVCTSVLKRICRSHGIVRWPYRKLVSGKSGDDTKNAEREKAKGLLEISKVAKQKALSASGLSTVSPGAFQGVAKSQQGSSKAGQVSPPGKQNVLGGSAILSYGTQTKGIPTYMDDFKYGFPSSGLSLQTMKWWGTDSHTETTPAKDDNGEAPESANEASKGMTDDELDWGADEAEAEADADSAITTEPSAQLCSLRRKAVDDGRKLLTGKSCGGLELCRLNKRQKMALAQVFGASLPEQLRSKLG